MRTVLLPFYAIISMSDSNPLQHLQIVLLTNLFQRNANVGSQMRHKNRFWDNRWCREIDATYYHKILDHNIAVLQWLITLCLTPSNVAILMHIQPLMYSRCCWLPHTLQLICIQDQNSKKQQKLCSFHAKKSAHVYQRRINWSKCCPVKKVHVSKPWNVLANKPFKTWRVLKIFLQKAELLKSYGK